MWKNFKIRTKMLIGFGLVFAVFGLSILVTGSYLDDIRKENDFIANRVIPAQALCIAINDNSYELMLELRAFLAEESQESAARSRQLIANIQKTMSEIQDLYATTPQLESLAHQVNAVFPRLREYFGVIEQSFTATFAKNELQARMEEIGNELSRQTIEFKQLLVNSALMEAGTATSDTFRRYMACRISSSSLNIRNSTFPGSFV